MSEVDISISDPLYIIFALLGKRCSITGYTHKNHSRPALGTCQPHADTQTLHYGQIKANSLQLVEIQKSVKKNIDSVKKLQNQCFSSITCHYIGISTNQQNCSNQPLFIQEPVSLRHLLKSSKMHLLLTFTHSTREIPHCARHDRATPKRSQNYSIVSIREKPVRSKTERTSFERLRSTNLPPLETTDL